MRDESGVLAKLSGALGDASISIDQMVQDHESGAEGTASIALLTHEAREGNLRESLANIDETLKLTTAPTHVIRIVD